MTELKKFPFLISEMLLMILCLVNMSPLAAASSDTLKIIHLTDTHICNLTGYHPVQITAREHYGQGMEPLKQFLHTVPVQNKVNAVIITGDLIDFFEAETAAGRMLATQIEQFVPLYFECPLPLYLTLGNHDITSYWVEEPDKRKSFQYQAHQARATWIRNIPCFQNGIYYVRSFPVGQATYRFVFLDNGYYLPDGAFIDQIQLDWLHYQMQMSRSDPVVIFTHKYLPIPDANGDGIMFNKKNVLNIDEQTCSTGFLKVLNENSNIKAMFVGHGHRNVTENLILPSTHRIVQIETSGFANDVKNWRLLKFTETSILISPCGDDHEKTVIIIN